MSEPDGSQGFVLVILGPGDQDVMQHTVGVLKHFGVFHRVANWNDSALPALIAAHASEPGVIVLGTSVPYTDEHAPPLPEGVFWPVIKVAASSPSSGALLTTTPFAALAGFGLEGAVNAGLLATRILALNNPTLRQLLATKPYPPPATPPPA